MLTIGIDVGITGAIAIIDQHGQVVAMTDLPITVHGSAKWVDAMELIAFLRESTDGIAHVNVPKRAFVEYVHAMPSMGVVACYSKGMTLASTLAALQVAGIPIELVPPGTWKRSMGLVMPNATDREKKAHSLSRARLAFPMASLSRVKDHNRAEALLIAEYGRRLQQGAAAA